MSTRVRQAFQSTESAVDQFVFYTYDGGTTWQGLTAGLNLG